MSVSRFLQDARGMLALGMAVSLLGATSVMAEVLEPDPELIEAEALFGDTDPLTDDFALAVPEDVSPTDYVLAVIFDDVSPTARNGEPAPWLTVADAEGEVSGTIATGDAMSCEIAIDPTGLAVGEYGATITCGAAWGDVRVILVIQNDMELAAVAGDFTGDGLTDLVAVNRRGNVYIWPAAEGFAVVNEAGDLGVQGYPAAGDLDGDGLADLLLLDDAGKATYWLSSQGYTAGLEADLETMGWPLLGDVDGDRVADVLIIDEDGANISFWLSTQLYAEKHVQALGLAGQPVMGDLDGDGLADILIVDDQGQGWALLSSLDYGAYPDNPIDLGLEGFAVTGDFNYDGLADILDILDNQVHAYLSPVWQRSMEAYTLPMPATE